MASPHCLPSNITPEIFLAEYWQKKPLLIKQGLPQLIGMFEPDDILGLTLDEEASARLIKQTVNPAITNPTTKSGALNDYPWQWQVKNSPLSESDFDNLPEQWTTLVQNMEQWSPELGALWQAFDFLPQWQRDDIMVSFAPTGGSVGKHYDDYDVFLAQGYGSRRWQLGKYCDETTEFVADQPIRIFDDMGEIIFDEILEAGDVIYVPPKLAHNGIAQDDCLTFSFGFRRPNLMQVLDGLTDIALSEPKLFVPMILEQGLQPSGQLSGDSVQAIKSQLIDMLNTPLGDDLISQAVSESVSKRQYDILTPEENLTGDEVSESLADGASLKIDYNSRLIYCDSCDDGVRDNFRDNVRDNVKKLIYANGQLITEIDKVESDLLARLANGESLTQSDITPIKIERVMEWLENGWVWLDF